MTLEERIRQLLTHHGIERAHFVGGGMVNNLIELGTSAPDFVASLTLVCPISVPQTLARDMGVPLSIVSGDQGVDAGKIERALASLQAHVQAMKTSADLVPLIPRMKRELSALGVDFNSFSIGLFDEKDGQFHFLLIGRAHRAMRT